MGALFLSFWMLFMNNGTASDTTHDRVPALRAKAADPLGENPMALDPSMKAFLAQHIREDAGKRAIFNRLLLIVFDRSYLNFQYDDSRTRTAREAFSERKGNCVSFSMMFVAMARSFGLDAQFQEVELFRSSRNKATKLSSMHMNVSVRMRGWNRDADFYPNQPKRYRKKRILGDTAAMGHYYNNLGAEYLVRGDYDRAFVYLQAAVDHGPNFAQAWNNFGVCCRKLGRHELAEKAYLNAIEKRPKYRTALENLAMMYFDTGRFEQASKAFAEIPKKRTNPYEEFTDALQDLENRNWQNAEKRLLKAIARKPHHSGFYFTLGELYQRMGDGEAALLYFEKARSQWQQRNDRDRPTQWIQWRHPQETDPGRTF